MKDGQDIAAVNRDHAPSIFAKWVFWLSHLAIILVCVWLTYSDGLQTIGNLFGKNWSLSDPFRAQILLACATLYWVRHGITLFYLLKRQIKWGEVFGLLIFMALFEIGLVLLGGGALRNEAIGINWLDGLALLLLLAGSYLNSGSEIQRNWWKKDQANKGHCYTQGLFKHAIHINYFGDIVLFTGWCLFTQNLWTLGLPIFMAYSFIFLHIPGLDAYLKSRYKSEFDTYSASTKKLIPWVY